MERTLWGIVIALFLSSSVIFYTKGRNRELITEKRILYGFSVFFLLYAIARIFIILSDLHLEGYYSGDSFFGDLINLNNDYIILRKVSWSLSYLGITSIVFSFERNYQKSKYIPSIIIMVLFFFMIFADYSISTIIANTIVIPLSSIIILIFFLQMVKYSPDQFKALLAFLVAGVILYVIGVGLGGSIKNLEIVPLWISPLMIVLGCIMFIIPFYINPKYIANSKKILKTVGIFQVVLTGLGTIVYFILFGVITLSFVSLAFVLFQIFFFKRALKYVEVKEEDIEEKPEEPVEMKKPALLSMFSRPERVTEEEISISKEKKICLVCKNKIGGYNFMCLDCGAFYCKKCVDSLVTMENACWVCNSPFDKTKAVKFYSEKEEQPFNKRKGKNRKK